MRNSYVDPISPFLVMVQVLTFVVYFSLLSTSTSVHIAATSVGRVLLDLMPSIDTKDPMVTRVFPLHQASSFLVNLVAPKNDLCKIR